MRPNTFQKRLLAWYDKAGRHNLPWQTNKSPYRVWVSEIMLQQTQAQTVIPYFKRFMKRFPSLRQLAEAPEDEVFSYWSGLGFYARARNLHKTAKQLLEEKRGRFPTTVKELVHYPGIGRSTAGAILSISKGLPTPILDGNVKRVLARCFRLDGDPDNSTVQKKFWLIAENLMPQARCADYTQAIMDLGATLCTRGDPACSRCPLKGGCQSYRADETHLFPMKRRKVQVKRTPLCFLVVKNTSNEVFLTKRENTGIWGGLWAFPHYATPKEALQAFEKRQEYTPKRITSLPMFKHLLTHITFTIQPLLLDISTQPKAMAPMASGEELWYNLSHPLPGGIPKPVAQILGDLRDEKDD